MQRIAYTLAALLLTLGALSAAADDAADATLASADNVEASDAPGSIDAAIAEETAAAAALDASSSLDASLDASLDTSSAVDAAAVADAEAAPEDAGAAPEGAGATPDGAGATPDGAGAAPEGAGAAPEIASLAGDMPTETEAAGAAEPASDTPALAGQMEGIKRDLVELKRDLVVLEEDLLYPASSQVAVFLSMDVGEFFALDSVTLKLNGKDVTHYLYTEKQTDALFRGGVQRLYVGNVKQGENQLTAFFTGRGPEGRDYSRAATVTFEKSFEPSFVELKISDSTAKYQPEFVATVSP